LLGVVAVFRIGQAVGSSAFGLLVAALALVPGVGSLLSIWTYFRAARALKEKGLTTRNALLDADEVRALGGLDGSAMLPSTKTLLALVILAAAGCAAYMAQVF
jgi:hypothetical protein